MKKTLLTLAIAVALLNVSAEEVKESYDGHRIGAGYANTVFVDTNNNDHYYGNGIKIEYGYDINRVVGLNAGYSINDGFERGVEWKGRTFALSTDLGYAMDFGSWNLKPYGVIGLANYDESWTNSRSSGSYNNTALQVGFGARFQWNQGLYIDLRSVGMADQYDAIGQGTVTAGYRF